MLTLRRISPRTVVGSGPRPRHLVLTAAYLALVVVGGTIVASRATASASGLERTPAIAVDRVLAPVADAAALGAGVASASIREGAVAGTPPPPPPAYCPVPGSEFIDSWGFARSGGRRHEGVDMMAPHGTPVLAPVDGEVRHSNSRLGGLGFHLEDAEGNTYFGSHLGSLGPTGPVEAGTRIGTVGSTGNASASGPHLHFEVMPAGRGSVNPYPVVVEWCRAAGSDGRDVVDALAARPS